MNWAEWFEMNWMIWNELNELNELNDLNWIEWVEWIEWFELNWINLNKRATLARATRVVIYSIFVLGPSALGMGKLPLTIEI